MVIDVPDHGLDRQRGEIRGVAVLTQRRIERLLAIIIGNTRLGQINGHFLHGQSRTATSLTNAQHIVRLLAHHGFLNHGRTAREHRRNLQFHHCRTGDFIRQQLDCLECGVNRLAAERIESGHQNLAHH